MSKFMTGAELMAKLPQPEPKRVRRPWTLEDDAKLEQLIREGRGLSHVARILDRSAQLIQRKRKDLIAKDPSLAHCAQIRSSSWDADEDSTLRKMWSMGATVESIAVALGRSLQSVKARRRLLKLPVRPGALKSLQAENARLREHISVAHRQVMNGHRTCARDTLEAALR